MFGRTADKIKHSWAGGNGRMVASSDVMRWSGSRGLLCLLSQRVQSSSLNFQFPPLVELVGTRTESKGCEVRCEVERRSYQIVL